MASHRVGHHCALGLLEQKSAGPAAEETNGRAGSQLLDGADVLRLGALLALANLEFDLLVFLEGPVAATGDCGEVSEKIRTSVVGRDEAEAFFGVEPFDRACCHDLVPSGRLRVATFQRRSRHPVDRLCALTVSGNR